MSKVIFYIWNILKYIFKNKTLPPKTFSSQNSLESMKRGFQLVHEKLKISESHIQQKADEIIALLPEEYEKALTSGRLYISLWVETFGSREALERVYPILKSKLEALNIEVKRDGCGPINITVSDIKKLVSNLEHQQFLEKHDFTDIHKNGIYR